MSSSTIAVTRQDYPDGEARFFNPITLITGERMSNNNAPPRTGHLYLVGVGPGDPELMTYKAVRILSQTRIWAVPKAKENGISSALGIASQIVEPSGRTILELCFPMKKVYLGQETDRALLEAWGKAADEVIRHLDRGEDVAFPTLGDATLYSTAFYLLPMIQEQRPTHPGDGGAGHHRHGCLRSLPVQPARPWRRRSGCGAGRL